MTIKRVIEVFTNPPGTARIFASRPDVMTIQYNGNTYSDYITEADAPSGAVYIGEMQPDGTVKDIVGNMTDFPFHSYSGWDRPTLPNTTPVITLAADVAKVMLLRSGYIDTVKAVIDSLGQEAILSWESAPYMRSDHPLVNAVLSQVGLTQAQIYQLFVDASAI